MAGTEQVGVVPRALAALAMVASVLALTNRRNISLGRRTRHPSAPLDRTLASASPAVVGGSPQRRLYTGANLGRVITIEDLLLGSFLVTATGAQPRRSRRALS
jgi:hypothetical protein